MEKILIIKIKNELEDIKKRHKARYGAVILDVCAKDINNVLFLEGVVLSEKQKKEVFLAVKEVVKNGKIENNIKVLGDLKENLEIGWGVVDVEVADIWGKFPDKKNPTGLASQASKSDFVRVLAKKGSWSLVQTRDLAIGWMKKNEKLKIKNEKLIESWKNTKRVKLGKTTRKRLAENIQSKFMSFLKKYLNAPYLLGGMTEKGIDCSGLAENFYSDIFGIVLPRHSSDQALCGEKIELGVAHFGDLIFLRHKTTKLAHIGIVVEKTEKQKLKRQNFENVLILNSRPEKGVTIEDLPEILKLYNLISVRRIIKDF